MGLKGKAFMAASTQHSHRTGTDQPGRLAGLDVTEVVPEPSSSDRGVGASRVSLGVGFQTSSAHQAPAGTGSLEAAHLQQTAASRRVEQDILSLVLRRHSFFTVFIGRAFDLYVANHSYTWLAR